MRIEEDILIENYLKNTLSEFEKKEFLRRMKKDVDFKEKIIFEEELFKTLNEEDWCFLQETNSEELKMLKNVFKSDDVRKTKNTITKAYKEYKSISFKNKVLKFSYLGAASVLVFIIAYSLFYQTNYSSSELYTEYMFKNEMYSNVTREGGSGIENLVKGETYFNNKEYNKALFVFTKELSKNKNNASVYLYIAISQIELSKYDDAKTTLENLIDSDLVDAEKGYWYKSLLYVKTNQLEEAKKLLQLIVKNKYFKYKESRELLKKTR